MRVLHMSFLVRALLVQLVQNLATDLRRNRKIQKSILEWRDQVLVVFGEGANIDIEALRARVDNNRIGDRGARGVANS